MRGDLPPFGGRSLRRRDRRLGGSLRSGGDRHGERERAALPRGALEPDASALELDELLRDREAEPGAAELPGRARVLLAEFVEDVALRLGPDPDPGIGDAHDDVE